MKLTATQDEYWLARLFAFMRAQKIGGAEVTEENFMNFCNADEALAELLLAKKLNVFPRMPDQTCIVSSRGAPIYTIWVENPRDVYEILPIAKKEDVHVVISGKGLEFEILGFSRGKQVFKNSDLKSWPY